MDASLAREFKEPFCGGQFRPERFPVGKAFSTYNDHSRHILDVKTPHGPVLFCVESIGETLNGGEQNDRLT